ncbi:hypothetical protein [uncultured Prevotellamassilia sp.]|uniref:hypothetical protein n=1 Tax=uncultured Prevotellamassilia sp. TaxID=1926676 RepID=UPI00258F478E|nr:hypothetical protein [uncultured Prevotellamassilia sp.]
MTAALLRQSLDTAEAIIGDVLGSPMRYAFLLKKRTGLNISDNCLCRVSHEIARSKAPATAPEGSAPAPMQPASAAPTTTPKRTRKPAAKRTTRKRANATA